MTKEQQQVALEFAEKEHLDGSVTVRWWDLIGLRMQQQTTNKVKPVYAAMCAGSEIVSIKQVATMYGLTVKILRSGAISVKPKTRTESAPPENIRRMLSRLAQKSLNNHVKEKKELDSLNKAA